MNNHQKVALVTGSSRGLGRQTAKLLARSGYRIVLHGRNREQLEITRQAFESEGIKAITIAADVTKMDEVKSMISLIIKELGRLDVLVTNASLTMETEFTETSATAFRNVVDSHIYGSVFPIMAAFDEIKANKGSIILISSLAGLHGLPRFSAYCAGKMALTAFWQSLAMEQKNSGLHLGLVHLPFVQNDPNKTLVNGDGELEKMPPRPTVIQQSQDKVALGIYRAIRKRKKRIILSGYGIIFSWFIRIFPRVTFFMISKFFKT